MMVAKALAVLETSEAYVRWVVDEAKIRNSS